MCVSFYQNLTPYDIKIATTPVCCYNCHVGVTEAIQTYMSEVRVSHLGPLTVHPNRRIYYTSIRKDMEGKRLWNILFQNLHGRTANPRMSVTTWEQPTTRPKFQRNKTPNCYRYINRFCLSLPSATPSGLRVVDRMGCVNTVKSRRNNKWYLSRKITTCTKIRLKK